MVPLVKLRKKAYRRSPFPVPLVPKCPIPRSQARLMQPPPRMLKSTPPSSSNFYPHTSLAVPHILLFLLAIASTSTSARQVAVRTTRTITSGLRRGWSIVLRAATPPVVALTISLMRPLYQGRGAMLPLVCLMQQQRRTHRLLHRKLYLSA